MMYNNYFHFMEEEDLPKITQLLVAESGFEPLTSEPVRLAVGHRTWTSESSPPLRFLFRERTGPPV